MDFVSTNSPSDFTLGQLSRRYAALLPNAEPSKPNIKPRVYNPISGGECNGRGLLGHICEDILWGTLLNQCITAFK